MTHTTQNPFQDYAELNAEQLPDAVVSVVTNAAACWDISPGAALVTLLSMVGNCLGSAVSSRGCNGRIITPNLHFVMVADHCSPRRRGIQALVHPLVSLEAVASEKRKDCHPRTLVKQAEMKRLECRAAQSLPDLSYDARARATAERLEAALPCVEPIVLSGTRPAEVRAIIDRNDAVWWHEMEGQPMEAIGRLPKALRRQLKVAMDPLMPNRGNRGDMSLFVVTDPADAATTIGRHDGFLPLPILFYPVSDEEPVRKEMGSDWCDHEVSSIVQAALTTNLFDRPHVFQMDNKIYETLDDWFNRFCGGRRMPSLWEPSLADLDELVLKVGLLFSFLMRYPVPPGEAFARALPVAAHLAWAHLETLHRLEGIAGVSSVEDRTPEDEMLDRIHRLIEKNGEAPTILAVRRTFNKQSISVHQPVLDRLVEAGLVEVDENRRLRPTE